MTRIDPHVLLAAYAQGIFPMGESRHSEDVAWYTTNKRGIIPISTAHIPRRLARTLRHGHHVVTVNHDFSAVLHACAAPRTADADTWINKPIAEAYQNLHQLGFAHSIEVWHQKSLIGGLYGVAMGRAFFAESMFSCARDGSKIALAHLLARLHYYKFILCDTQFLTPHLEQFGACEIMADEYDLLLQQAIDTQATCRFSQPGEPAAILMMRNYLQALQSAGSAALFRQHY